MSFQAGVVIDLKVHREIGLLPNGIAKLEEMELYKKAIL